MIFEGNGWLAFGAYQHPFSWLTTQWTCHHILPLGDCFLGRLVRGRNWWDTEVHSQQEGASVNGTGSKSRGEYSTHCSWNTSGSFITTGYCYQYNPAGECYFSAAEKEHFHHSTKIFMHNCGPTFHMINHVSGRGIGEKIENKRNDPMYHVSWPFYWLIWNSLFLWVVKYHCRFIPWRTGQTFI